MKESMKESLMSGFVGKALIALVSLVIGIITVLIVRPGISVGSGVPSTESSGIIELFKEFKSLFYFLGAMISVNVFSLVSDKIQATKQKNERELEIKMLEAQNKQLELQNKQLELQQENQQAPPKE